MKELQLPHLMLDQSKDLVWIVNKEYELIYANRTYFRFMKEITGIEKKLNDSAFFKKFGEADILKWKSYFNRALDGESFEVEEYFSLVDFDSAEFVYSLVTFEPIYADDQSIIAVSCRSKDFEKIVKERTTLNQLMEASLDVFCTIDGEGNFVHVSSASSSLWGYTPEELIGKPYINLVLKEDVTRTQECAASIMAGQDDKTFANRYIRKDGQIAYNFWSARWDSSFKLFICVARDGKEKIEQEEKIRLSQQRFESLVENSMDGIIILSPEGKTTYVSGSVKNILGYSPEEVMGMDIREVIHPEDIAGTGDAIASSILQPGVPMKGYISRLKHKDGSWKWIEPILNNMIHDPSIRGIVDNFRDITDKVEEQQKLKLFESVILNTNDAIVITEAEQLGELGHRIIYVNDAFKRMTGYDKVDVLGRSSRLLLGPNSSQVELDKMYLAIANWEPCELTSIGYKKSGEEIWMNVSLNPVTNDTGLKTNWVAILRDVTEQKTKELEKDLFEDLRNVFHQGIDEDLTECLTKLCKLITRIGDVDFAEMWLPAIDGKKINLVANYICSAHNNPFYDVTEKLKKCEYGEGMPGFVWKSKTIEIWENTEGNWLPKRREAAKKSGIKTTMGLPIKKNDEVIGVLLIGSENSKELIKKHSELLQKFEPTIGEELSSKKIEVELAQIFNCTPDMICVAGFDGYVKRINPAGLEILGYSLEEIRSRPISSFVHEDDRLLTVANQKKLYRGESLRNFENRYITNDGKVIWLSWTSTSSPEHGVVYAVAKNITEEKKLRELNRQVNELSKIGSWEVDLSSDTLFWSDEVHKIHETDYHSYVPNIENAILFYREDFRQTVYNDFEECAKTGKSFDFEAVIITKNKKEVWVRATGNSEFKNGQCTRLYGSFQDINDRKQAETRLQSFAGNLPGVAFQYLLLPNGTDKITFATKGAKQIWGFTSEEVIENSNLIWDNVKAGGDFDEIQTSITAALETNSKWSSRFRYLMPSGELRVYLASGTPKTLADGTIEFNSIVLDVTEQTKKEKLLEQVTKQAKIGSWVTDLVNGEHYLSEMACSIIELELKEKIPDMDGIINYCRDDFREMALSKLKDCILKGTSFDFEVVIVTTSKKEKWVRIIGSAEIHNGRCHKIFGSVQDINSVKETEDRLSSFSENLPGVIYQYLIHPDGTDSVRYVSKGAKQLWGYTAKQVTENVHLLWDRLKAANEDAKFLKIVQNAIETKTKWSDRFKYVMPTGELRIHLSHGVPVFLADGTIVCNVMVFDITQEVNNERLLTQASEMAQIGSWEKNLIEPDGDQMYWSSMVKRILEVDDSYVATLLDGVSFFIDESKERIQLALANLMNDGIDFDIEVLLRSAKGNEKWVRVIGKSEMVNNKRTKVYGSLQDIHQRKMASLELEKSLKSLEDYKFSLDQAAIIAFTDSKGVITSVNDNFCKISKYEESEIIGKTHRLINSGYHSKEFFVDLWTTISSGQVWRGEVKNQSKDGLFYWVDTTIVPFLDEENKPFQYLAIRFDITTRKNAEQEKSNLQATLENSLNEIYIFDSKTLLFSYVNKGALINMGYSFDEMLHLTPVDIKTDFTLASFNEIIAPVVNDEKEKIVFFTHHQRKDGSLYPVEVHLQLIKDDRNSRFLAVILDITERKKAEGVVLEANERFEKVTEATNDAIWDWDIVNQTFYRSKAIERFFGENTLKSLHEKDFWKDSFHPEDLDEIRNSVNEAINDPTSNRWELEYRLLNAQGDIHFVNDRGIIIRNDQGKAIRMVGAMTDVTQQKRMELTLKNLNSELEQHTIQLEHSNEELEQFAFVASHDLQEPLRMISSFMDLLKRKYSDQLDEKALKYIHFAMDGANRMKQIILDLLDYSKAGKLKEDLVSIDLNQTLEDYAILRRRIINEKKALLIYENLHTVNANKAPLTQTVHCLLDNAIKYSKEGVQPKIEIMTSENEQEWIVQIKDNGIGIDKDFYDKIFVIFQRLHNKDKYDGTGIGLSIAKKNVESINGRIWVESTINEGSTFYFSIKKN